MLSYRHAFHAGNHADVLKHSILSRIILYLVQKEKPFSYIETHAGAGLYHLDGEWAKKTGEASSGIIKLLNTPAIPELFNPYLEICRSLFADEHQYPGSPEIARALSRNDDQLTLIELHSSEIEILRENFSGDPRIHLHNRDGFSGLTALTPPNPRRGVALIDPSYEMANDYKKVVDTLLSVHTRWPAGMLVLWYPILGRRIEEVFQLKKALTESGIPGILNAEVLLNEPESSPETEEGTAGFGLAGSGMIIIQPPWTLFDELKIMLPFLSETLCNDGKGSWKTEWLTKA
ncbi:MAG TPA: 23S rRNA (adenine(2030)-N(6))-methyltransferase RlmJ [Treponema sp.]|nr:23S rRNA (adenine(2030)-N(6))-methyltransferase RlmJ [Treponema sp.]